MKNKITLGIAALVIVVLGAGGALLFAGGSNADPDCRSAKNVETHTVMIMDNKVDPVKTTGKRCDTLTIMNMDNVTRLVAFGPHEDHVPYDGVADKVLHQDQSLTITLNQTGNYRFHDHMHDEVQGYFTVTK